MRKFNDFQKGVSIMLSFILIISNSGCSSLQALNMQEIQNANKTTYLLCGPSSTYKLINAKISNGVLTGTIDYRVYKPEKAKAMYIYVAPDSSMKKNGDQVQVPFANIAKVETSQFDGLRTASSFGSFLLGACAFLAVLLIKGGSCPFIYANDGDNYHFTGEIYSGATALPLERDDYLPIRNTKPVNNKYNLRITNEVDEIQKTNLTELVVIDHQHNTKILMDKYGIAYSLSDPEMPVIAADAYGSPILNALIYRDSLRYISTIKKDPNIKDTISLSFDKPIDATSSKLVIKGKNTMWLDYMYCRFSDLFGKRFERWKEKNDKMPREELLKWAFDQGMPLAVYLQTDTGLKFVDYFNLPGPMADKEDILQIDLSQVHTDKVNLKLVSGVLFWDIDYIGMDFTPSDPVNKTIIKLFTAVDENGKDVSSLLSHNDEKYLVQPLPSNKTDLSFTAPESVPGMERSIFLHSKGHYEILRETKGKPDIAYLKTFLEPGAFIKFSKDHFLEYYYKSN